MRIKKKDYDSKAWPQKPSALISTKQSQDAFWPLPYHHDDDDDSSGCSFSSVPSSYFSDYDEDNLQDDLKDIGEKDTKLPPSSTTIQPKESQELSRYFFHMMPTTIHHAGTYPSSDGAPSNAHEADHDNNKDDKEITNSNDNHNNNHNVTSDLFQMGSLLVVGLVGFLVVFAVGVAVGEHQYRQDHDREDHSPYYYAWEAPRQITRHRRHFRDW